MVRNLLRILWGCAFLQCFAQVAIAQTPALHWANTASGITGVSDANEVATDPAGFVYVAGEFAGTVDFNPGAGVASFSTPPGIWHGFVQKLDTNGNFIWAAVFTCNNLIECMALDVDASGNVVVAGAFTGTADFNPGAGTNNLSAVGVEDQFVVKLNSAGTFQWARRTGASGLLCFPYRLQCDASGNVYTVGTFDGTIDFNPGAGTNNLSTGGIDDVYLQKLDAAGTFVYARRLGGSDYESPEGLTVDASSNLYISGSTFSSTVDFDPGIGVVNLAQIGVEDYYVQKLNSAGTYVGAVRFGGVTSTRCWGQAANDGSGNVFCGGSFDQTVDFDPGAGVSNLNAGTSSDGFVVKLNSSLAFQWVRQITCNDMLNNRLTKTDVNGNVYLMGDFKGTADFDPGPGSALRTSIDQVTYIVKLDGSGNFIWVAIFENPGNYSFGAGLDLDVNTNVYSCGYHFGTTDFDPQGTVFNMVSDDNDDWVLKLRQFPLPLPVAGIDLRGAGVAGAVDLQWSLESPMEVEHYFIERGEDGVSFVELSREERGCNGICSYRDTDVVAGLPYAYRVRAVDGNGGELRSAVVWATPSGGMADAGIYPNPSQGSIRVWSMEPMDWVRVVNPLGQVVLEVNGGGEKSLQLDLEGLPSGSYWVRVGRKVLPLQLHSAR
ncbi:MAG: T9SS type A sorting domain-containing protein [Bacteroidia bacterium]